MSLFLSTYINKIDSKGRVSVPANFRINLMHDHFQGVILFRSYKYDALECSSYARIEQISQLIDSQTDIFSDAQDNITTSIFADCVQLSFDTEGRIGLPQKFIEFAKLSDKAAFVGRGKTFQIWCPKNFIAIQDEARKLMQSEKITLRMSGDSSSSRRI